MRISILVGANPDILFDDYHRLTELELRCLRLIICQGMNGSGKTTALPGTPAPA